MLILDLQVANFVSSNDNSTETTGVFDDGYWVDFFQTFIDNTSTTNVSEP